MKNLIALTLAFFAVGCGGSMAETGRSGHARLLPGSGYVFDTQAVVSGGAARDIWWNNAGLVPGAGGGEEGKMYSIGVTKDLEFVDPDTTKLTWGQFKPQVGEEFVVSVTGLSSDKTQLVTAYTLIRITKIGESAGLMVSTSPDDALEFDWVTQ